MFLRPLSPHLLTQLLLLVVARHRVTVEDLLLPDGYLLCRRLRLTTTSNPSHRSISPPPSLSEGRQRRRDEEGGRGGGRGRAARARLLSEGSLLDVTAVGLVVLGPRHELVESAEDGLVGGLQKSEGVLQSSDTSLVQSGQDDHESVVVVQFLEMSSHPNEERHSIRPEVDMGQHQHRVRHPVGQGIEAIDEGPRAPAETAI